MDTHLTPDSPRQSAGLERAEFAELVFRSCAEWDAGNQMPSLVAIRERGTAEQYAEAITLITRHDDTQRDREIERQVTRLRAERAD